MYRPINVFLGEDINLLSPVHLPNHIIIPRGSQIIVAGIIKQRWNYFPENFLPCEHQGYSSRFEDKITLEKAVASFLETKRSKGSIRLSFKKVRPPGSPFSKI